MINNINIVGNSCQITVTGNTPEQIFENILKGIEAENLKNISVSTQAENIIFRESFYTETSYFFRLSTPASPIAIDPDNI